MDKNKNVEVYWTDAFFYSRQQNLKSLRPQKKLTKGVVLQENKEFLIIKNPQTAKLNPKTKRYEFSNSGSLPTFLFLPKGMIEKIKNLNSL